MENTAVQVGKDCWCILLFIRYVSETGVSQGKVSAEKERIISILRS
jgi:hypothetical protein